MSPTLYGINEPIKLIICEIDQLKWQFVISLHLRRKYNLTPIENKNTKKKISNIKMERNQEKESQSSNNGGQPLRQK